MSERAKRHQAGLSRSHNGQGAGRSPDDIEFPGIASGMLTPRTALAWQRAAGNRAVGGVLQAVQRAGAAAATPIPVQRWAWVDGARIRPEDPDLNEEEQALASDERVHEYESRDEFRKHAAGETDYIGNLPGPASAGTWVRFAPTGTNLIGENHTRVTLEHVVRAVGASSFIYEPFSVDKMAPDSEMKTAYETENEDRFQQFGIGGVADKRPFGAESLFPKMGEALNLLLPYLKTPGDFEGLKPGRYSGQPIQRYLKIAWAHGKDIAAKVADLSSARKLFLPMEEKRLVATIDATLDPFITALPVDGYLGDALDSQDGRAAVPKLLEFCQAFVDAMLVQAGADEDLAKKGRKQLRRMPKGSKEDRGAVFLQWRNLHFSHAVRDAVKRGVRYAGMGNNHRRYLLAEGLPPNIQEYDMTGKDLIRFEERTGRRAASARQ